MSAYDVFFNLVFKRMDPETAHGFAAGFIKRLPAQLARFTRPAPQLRTRALGQTFPTPFGLAAGFDKNAEMITGLGVLGFGHVEVGTLTQHPQPGNPQPRLFRLLADRALINRMGFNNGGSMAAAPRILRARLQANRPVIGVNIGKSRVTEVADATADYVWSAKRLAGVADYLAVNVSSPNTPGLRGLQELEMLEPLLTEVLAAAGGTPLLVKIAPDMDDEQITAITQLAKRLGLAGIIAHNTTVSRDGLRTPAPQLAAIGAGGLSGAPLRDRSLAVLQVVRAACPDPDFCVISVGGVATAEDVLARLEAGATLVQGFSEFIYAGPLWARKINRDLVRLGYRGDAA